MNITNKKLWVVGAIVIGLSGIGFLGQMSLAQNTPTQNIQEGRYRITVVNDNNPSIFLLDSQTGRCWVKYSLGSKWEEITPSGLPAK